MKYEFHVGDYVETVDGRIGYITETNFTYIPYIEYKLNDGETYYQTVGCQDADVWGQKLRETFNRIGQYDFTKKDEGKIEPLCEEYTKSFPICKTTTTENDSEWRSIDISAVSRKINELVEAVNRLEEKVNEMA